MSKTRIPETISDFDAYLNSTDKYLQEIVTGTTHRWEVLGVSPENAAEWHSRCLTWKDDLFPKYGSAVLSTTLVKAHVRTFMKDFRTFGNPVLNGIASNPNAGTDDEIMFNFKIKKSKPTRKENSIEETVMYGVELRGGGDLHFSCRVASHSGRPKIADGANSVQLSFYIMPLEDNPFKPSNSGKPMLFPDQPAMSKEVFTRAIFLLRTSVGNVGKGALVYMRWYHTKHPQLSGPWSVAQFIVIG